MTIQIQDEDFYVKPLGPFQIDGINFLLNGPNGTAFLADEMGVTKTYQAINTASVLFQKDIIEMAIVVSPASVRGVWDNDETGQIKQYCKSDYIAIRYDADFRGSLPFAEGQLLWITISYSF